MGTEGLRKCCHCGIWFRPHGRNAWHQRFCLKSECQVASQQKWRRKNPGYFHGEMHVKRVREWRRKHPGYWNAKGGAESCRPPDALQDLLAAQGFGHEDVKVFRSCLSEEISRPLQEVSIAQQHTLVWLASAAGKVNDRQARLVRHSQRKGEKRIGRAITAIFFILRTGCQWKALPRSLGAPSTVYDYFRRWEQAGVFTSLWQQGLCEYDRQKGIGWKWQSVDGCMTKAPLGGEAVGPNPTDRAKSGTKRSLLTDAGGIPLALAVDGANRHDKKMLEDTLRGLMAERPDPEETRQHLCLDKGL